MSFTQKVYALAKKIPEGRVTTYKLIAEKLNCGAYRAVGNALNKNPHKNVPCHRVVKSDGSVGGFARGTASKIKMLRKDGIKVKNGRIENFEKVLFRLQHSREGSYSFPGLQVFPLLQYIPFRQLNKSRG